VTPEHKRAVKSAMLESINAQDIEAALDELGIKEMPIGPRRREVALKIFEKYTFRLSRSLADQFDWTNEEAAQLRRLLQPFAKGFGDLSVAGDDDA